MPLPDAIARARYISLETFKRDGVGVRTPVWFGPLADGALGVFSEGKAWKVKRARNDPRCRVAACDLRGKVRGEWLDGTVTIVEDPSRRAEILAALRRQYGWQMWLADAGARATGRYGKRAFLEVRVSG